MVQSITQMDFRNWGMINMPPWMFLGSFADRKLRLNLIKEPEHRSLSIWDEVFLVRLPKFAFTLKTSSRLMGTFRRLFEGTVKVRATVSEIETLFLKDNYNHGFPSTRMHYFENPWAPDSILAEKSPRFLSNR